MARVSDPIARRELRRIEEQPQGLVTLRPVTVANLPDPARYPGRQVYVSNEAGGPVMAFSDGTDWRRVTDRAVVS